MVSCWRKRVMPDHDSLGRFEMIGALRGRQCEFWVSQNAAQLFKAGLIADDVNMPRVLCRLQWRDGRISEHQPVDPDIVSSTSRTASEAFLIVQVTPLSRRQVAEFDTADAHA